MLVGEETTGGPFIRLVGWACPAFRWYQASSSLLEFPFPPPFLPLSSPFFHLKINTYYYYYYYYLLPLLTPTPTTTTTPTTPTATTTTTSTITTTNYY